MSSTSPQIPPDVANSQVPDFDGWWAVFFDQFMKNSPALLEANKGNFGGVIAEIFATLVELGIEITSDIGKRVGEAVDEFEKTAGPEIERAAAAALSDYFNAPISVGDISRNRSASSRHAFAENLGSFVLENMFGAFEAPQKLTPDVGRQNAERILGYNIGTTLEGWLGKVVGQTPLTKWIPNWADLDTVMQQTLGLGRINRRIIGPLLKTLVADPFQWDLNRRFTPVLFTAPQLVRLRNKKLMTDGDYFEQMSWLGYDISKASKLRSVMSRLPEKEDVAKMLELGLITKERARAVYEGLGFTETGAEIMVAVTEDDRIRNINNAIESTARDMFRDREIDEPELKATLRAAGRSDAEVQAFVGLVLLERSRPRPLPRGLMEKAFREAFIPLGRLREFYETEGYSLEDRFLLEEMAVVDRLAVDERERRAKDKAKGDEFRTLPKGQIERAYIEGIIPTSRLAAYYDDREYSLDDQAVLFELANKRKTAFDLKLELELERAKDPGFKALPRSSMEEAFIRGVVTEGRLRDWYAANNFDPGELPVLLGNVRARKLEREERLEDELARANRPDFTELPRSVIEEAFIRDVVDEPRLRSWYEGRGFRTEEIPLLLELVRDRKAARQAKAAAAATKQTA